MDGERGDLSTFVNTASLNLVLPEPAILGCMNALNATCSARYAARQGKAGDTFGGRHPQSAQQLHT